MRLVTAFAALSAAIIGTGFWTTTAPAATSARPIGVGGTIWITDRQNDRIAVYDTATATLLGTFSTEGTPDPLHADEPNDVAVAAGKAYVTNEASGTISVFDASTRALLTRLSAGPRPHHASASQSEDLVAYGVYGTNQIGIIDTASGSIRRVTASNRSGTVLTHAPSFSPNGRTVFAANELRSGTTQLAGSVSAIDLATGKIKCELTVGVRPSEVVVTPDGRIGYASVRNEHLIKEVDFGSCRLTGRTVDIGEEVDTLDLSPNGQSLSVGLRGPAPKPARVAVVDLVSFRAQDVRYWTIPGGTLTGHQWTSPNRRYTYAAFEGTAPGVAVIDHLRNVVQTLPTIGSGRPHGIAFEPADDD
jgi:DNA-binding beta-propeller fold protein YncE